MSAERPRPTQEPKFSFRPDIQGIRAVAVLLVIANHLAPERLPGGFVGVDVFFVVSGYLITSLLLGEAGRSSRISLSGFYARRARRIIPAATVVTVVTVVGSLLTLPLLRVQTIITDAVWATFFAANVRMAQVGTDYFAKGQPPSPCGTTGRSRWRSSSTWSGRCCWSSCWCCSTAADAARSTTSGSAPAC